MPATFFTGAGVVRVVVEASVGAEGIDGHKCTTRAILCIISTSSLGPITGTSMMGTLMQRGSGMGMVR
jgi:hypothetical protein